MMVISPDLNTKFISGIKRVFTLNICALRKCETLLPVCYLIICHDITELIYVCAHQNKSPVRNILSSVFLFTVQKDLTEHLASV